MGAGCSTASVFIQMDEIVAIARSNRIEEALLKEEVVNFILQNKDIDQFLPKAVLYYTKVRRGNIRKSVVKVKIRTLEISVANFCVPNKPSLIPTLAL